MNRKDGFWLGIDYGGTKMLTAVLDSRFKIVGQCKVASVPTKGERHFIQALRDSVSGALKEARLPLKKVLGLGMGCPGMISEQGVVTLSPNIAFLKNYPLRKTLTKLFNVPAWVENDVNAGLYGESQLGAARGCKNVVGIFLGTGVGGAILMDGKLYRGTTGAAGEIGHTFLFPPSFLSPDDRSGTVEGILGRLRIASDAGILMMKQKAPTLLDAVDFDLRKIKSKALVKSIQGGDREVRQLLIRKSKALGLAMANVVNLLNPERIILGGGVIEALGDLMIPKARETMQKYAMGPIVKTVKVSASELGDDAIVLGAAKLIADSVETEGIKK